MDNQHYELFNMLLKEVRSTIYLTTKFSSGVKEYDGLRLHESESHMLQAIGKGIGITTNELAKEFNYTPSACSQVVKKLKENELVYLEKDSHDKRFSYLYLTQRGRKIFEQHEKEDEKSFAAIYKRFQKFSVEDLKMYLEIHKTLNSELEKSIFNF